jgi:hypothetical protein
MEAQATIKKYHQQIKEAQLVLESEQIQRDQGREKLIQAERRSHSIANELEESKTQLELADRQRRAAEQELSDVVEQLSDQTLQNQALQTAKRKLDSEIQTLQARFLIKIISLVSISQADLEEMVCESMVAEERAKKSMIDAARLADELRAEQENAQLSEKNRRSLDSQVNKPAKIHSGPAR